MPPPGPAALLQTDLATFTSNAPAMPPAEAAMGWLALFDRLANLTPAQRMAAYVPGESSSLDFGSLIGALPPPSAWEELRAHVAQRAAGDSTDEKYRNQLLTLFVHVLVNDQTASQQNVADLAVVISSMDASIQQSAARQLLELMQKMTALSGDKRGVKNAFEQGLKSSASSDHEDSLTVPDLVTLLGAAEAERLLRQALVLPRTRLDFQQGNETHKLARALAIERMDEIKMPPWDLVSDLDSAALYEAIVEHFPAGAAVGEDADDATFLSSPMALVNLPEAARRSVRKMLSGSSRSSWRDEPRRLAQQYYLLALIVHDRTEDAHSLALTMVGDENGSGLPSGALRQLEQAGYVDQVQNFLQDLLTANPELPFWDQYIALSAKTGETADVLHALMTSAKSTTLTPARRRELDGQLVSAWLAADKPDEAVTVIQRLLADDETDQNTRSALALKWATIGNLLQNPEWLEAGLKAALEAASKDDQQNPYAFYYGGKRLGDLLMDIGRGPEAEQLYADQLAKAIKPEGGMQSYRSPTDAQAPLQSLVSLYSNVDRLSDVLTLADTSPWWGVKDLANLGGSYESGFATGHGADTRTVPVPQAVAAALHARARDDHALPILEEIIANHGNYDPAYELYVTIRGTNAIPFLDLAYSRDQYEERPLIWKARALRVAGQLDAAEQAARAAIAIDPSDGEQGKGRRMRVYAELAEILAAKGDQENAEFFREVVVAIRIAERADDFYNAGLLTRGITIYREALSHFSDAYCIQSRMAIQLEERGDYAGAEKHYQRAYELMPDSFGRVESHCFGCEGVFSSGRAQNIAERVFTTLAQEAPDKPQVHYLLGYLRDEQGRDADALAEYRLAVKLDPDYLNAWKKIGDLGERMLLPAPDRDAAVFTQLRLDPLGRHGRPDTDDVVDLKQLWSSLAEARKLEPKTPESLYPFTASAAKLQEQEAAAKSATSPWSHGSYTSYSYGGYDEATQSPADSLKRHSIIREIMQLFEYAERMR